MHRIDLNCDLGESFGAYEIGADSAIIPHISSANIACGFHAGDASVMERTVALAAAAGVSCGAHPGLPDLAGFGRREMAVSPSEAKALVLYQIGAIEAFCRARGVPLFHVKAHGGTVQHGGKKTPTLPAPSAKRSLRSTATSRFSVWPEAKWSARRGRRDCASRAKYSPTARMKTTDRSFRGRKAAR